MAGSTRGSFAVRCWSAEDEDKDEDGEPSRSRSVACTPNAKTYDGATRERVAEDGAEADDWDGGACSNASVVYCTAMMVRTRNRPVGCGLNGNTKSSVCGTLSDLYSAN